MLHNQKISATFIAASALLTTIAVSGAAPAQAKSRHLLPSTDEMSKRLESLKKRSNATLLQGFANSPARLHSETREVVIDAVDSGIVETGWSEPSVEIGWDSEPQVVRGTGYTGGDLEIETFDKNFPGQEVEYAFGGENRSEDDNLTLDADAFPVMATRSHTSDSVGYRSTRRSPSVRSTSNPSSMERQILDLVNQERSRRGLRPLEWDGRLSRAGRDHSNDMARRNYFSHTSPEGSSVMDRALSRGVDFQTLGENLALDFSASSAHDSLMHSRGHRDNILGRSYKRCGIGVAVSPRGEILVTEVFAG